MKIPESMLNRVSLYSEKLKDKPKLQRMYRNSYLQTIKTSIKKCDDDSWFVLTGDIPAMWLRDSTAQITHYVDIAEDPEIAEIIEGVIRKQFLYIKIDPYANAFNERPNGHGHINDIPKNDPWVFERKYEIDSLCYPVRLLYLYWKKTGNEGIINDELESVSRIIIDLWRIEQYHMERSPYRFIRPDVPPDRPYDSIYNNGMGNPVAYTGMTWSGFRPSDDGCQYGYLIASEMFAVVALRYMAEMLSEVCNNTVLANECKQLANEIDNGIKKYGIINDEKYGEIYVYETDGYGSCLISDDANIPSLLSIPYIGYVEADDRIYQNTRKLLLSGDNEFYFEGKFAKGIGSRHTPKNHIWHMSLVMQGLTSISEKEKTEILDMLANTDGGTYYLHESFNADAPSDYTREWFTWPNSLFAEFIERCADEGII